MKRETLDTLINNEDKDGKYYNVYELTCVAIKEAEIMASKQKPVEPIEVEDGEDAIAPKPEEKIVSQALKKALDSEIEYTPVEKH